MWSAQAAHAHLQPVKMDSFAIFGEMQPCHLQPSGVRSNDSEASTQLTFAVPLPVAAAGAGQPFLLTSPLAWPLGPNLDDHCEGIGIHDPVSSACAFICRYSAIRPSICQNRHAGSFACLVSVHPMVSSHHELSQKQNVSVGIC